MWIETTHVFNAKHVLACLPGEGPKSHDREAYLNEEHYYSLFLWNLVAGFPVGEFPIGIPSRAQGYISTKMFLVWRCPSEQKHSRRKGGSFLLQKQDTSLVPVVTGRSSPVLSGPILVYHGDVLRGAGTRSRWWCDTKAYSAVSPTTLSMVVSHSITPPPLSVPLIMK